jgi:hypothetical protein
VHAETRAYAVDSDADVQHCLRQLANVKLSLPAGREQRAHLFVDAAHAEQPDESGCATLHVGGYVRGRALSVNQLVHISGVGTFQIAQVRARARVCPCALACVLACVCACVRACVRGSARVRACKRTRARACVCACMHDNMRAWLRMSTCLRGFARVRACYVRARARGRARVCVRTCLRGAEVVQINEQPDPCPATLDPPRTRSASSATADFSMDLERDAPAVTLGFGSASSAAGSAGQLKLALKPTPELQESLVCS